MSLVFEFNAAARGFHVYRDVWRPIEGEIRRCLFEENNIFDIFAIKVVDDTGIVIDHLPREISRPTKFLIDRGAAVTAKVSSTNIRRSPLFQGGLGIPCIVTVLFPRPMKGKQVLDRHRQMVNDLYNEPDEPIIVGSVENNSLNNVDWRMRVSVTKKKKEKKKEGEKVTARKRKTSTSILSYFKKK